MERSAEGLTERRAAEGELHEGRFAKAMEKVTTRVSPRTWLWLAVGSMAVSAGIAATTRRKEVANFIGLWVPSLLLMGIYNNLVNIQKSTSQSQSQPLH